MNGTKRLNIKISSDAERKMREAALFLGYRVPKGAMAGAGSVSAFLTALAEGRMSTQSLVEAFSSERAKS